MIENIYTKKNSTYVAKNPGWHVEDSKWKSLQISRILEKNKIRFNSICEIGCGAGEILRLLQLRFCSFNASFCGYEISPDAFDVAKMKEREGLQFYLENLFETDRLFDVLLVIDVFEHVPNYYRFIDNCKHRAEYKVFHIPLEMSVISVLRNKPLDAKKSVGHLHFFSKDTALEVLKDNGLNIVDVAYTHGAIEAPRRQARTRLLNCIRRILFKIAPDFTVRLLGGYSLLVLAK